MCAHTHIRKRHTIIGTRGITLYPVGHLSLLSSEDDMKFARFQSIRTERNKRLFNMSANRLLRMRLQSYKFILD